MNAGSARLEAAIGIVENAHTLPRQTKVSLHCFVSVSDSTSNLFRIGPWFLMRSSIWAASPLSFVSDTTNERGIQFQNGPQAFIISGPVCPIVTSTSMIN